MKGHQMQNKVTHYSYSDLVVLDTRFFVITTGNGIDVTASDDEYTFDSKSKLVEILVNAPEYDYTKLSVDEDRVYISQLRVLLDGIPNELEELKEYDSNGKLIKVWYDVYEDYNSYTPKIIKASDLSI